VNRYVLAVVRVLTFGRWPSEGVRAATTHSGRRVWRITPGRPGGEWVDANATPPRRDGDERSTLPLDSWTTSTMDLLDGVQIVEHDGDRDGHDGARPH
jgi:hypothetical protein